MVSSFEQGLATTYARGSGPNSSILPIPSTHTLQLRERRSQSASGTSLANSPIP
jgi:hypothetical protein